MFGKLEADFQLKLRISLIPELQIIFTSQLALVSLQYHGFTLGVADILVRKEADKQRRKEIEALRKCGIHFDGKLYLLNLFLSLKVKNIFCFIS